jgi:hypothetical protein
MEQDKEIVSKCIALEKNTSKRVWRGVLCFLLGREAQKYVPQSRDGLHWYPFGSIDTIEH